MKRNKHEFVYEKEYDAKDTEMVEHLFDASIQLKIVAEIRFLMACIYVHALIEVQGKFIEFKF